MGMPGSSAGLTEVSKYKLIRFFDYEAEPGKVYRYRIRVLIEDPNHPQTADSAPDPRTLSSTLAQREKQMDDNEIKNKAKRVYWRETEWSEASNSVTLPASTHFIASKVQQRAPLENRELKVQVPLDEPTASMLSVVWDPARATEIPGNADLADDPKLKDKEKPILSRSSVLNFKKDTKVLRPDTLELKLVEKFEFKTNAIVVDLRPGEPVRDGAKKPGEKREPPASAGEILIIDGDGKFVVRNELDDLEDFRRLSFTDELTGAADAGAGGMMPGMPGMPGMGGGDPSMPPGMPKGGKGGASGPPGMSPPGGKGGR
ncbi:MAG: hypothetical protein ACKOUR_20370, partial [Planctomycetota bacterium]